MLAVFVLFIFRRGFKPLAIPFRGGGGASAPFRSLLRVIQKLLPLLFVHSPLFEPFRED